MRIDNWWPGLTFYVPIPGQPQGTSDGTNRATQWAVRNVSPVYSTIEATSMPKNPGNHWSLSKGGASRTNDTQVKAPGYQRPCVSAVLGHAKVALVVFGVLPIVMANPVDASAKEREMPLSWMPLAQQAVSWLAMFAQRQASATPSKLPPVTTQIVSPAEAMLPLDARMRPWCLSEVRCMATRPGLTGIV